MPNATRFATSAPPPLPPAIVHCRLASSLFDQEKEPLESAALHNRLPLALHAQSEHTEAETLFRSILAIREGRLDEAEPLYRRIVWIHGVIQRKSGQPDPDFEEVKKSYSVLLHDLLRRGQRVPVGGILRRVESAVEGKDVERPGN